VAHGEAAVRDSRAGAHFFPGGDGEEKGEEGEGEGPGGAHLAEREGGRGLRARRLGLLGRFRPV
jgi:hypothetical protein